MMLIIIIKKNKKKEKLECNISKTIIFTTFITTSAQTVWMIIK